MSRLFRFILGLFSAMLLLAFLATCILWYRSYNNPDPLTRRDAFRRVTGDTWLELANDRGNLYLLHATGCRLGTGSFHRRRWIGPRFEVEFAASDHLLRESDNRSRLIGDSDSQFFEGHFETGHVDPGDVRFQPENAFPQYRLLVLRHWIVASALGLLVMLRVLFMIRRHRRFRLPHQCRNCGYDLRATPDAAGALVDRCPECGAQRPGAAALSMMK